MLMDSVGQELRMALLCSSKSGGDSNSWKLLAPILVPGLAPLKDWLSWTVA